MRSTTNTQVRFYEATPKTETNPAGVSTPNFKAVQDLGLKDKPDARIEFEGRGNVIYAKIGAEPNRAKLLWEAAYGRSKNRKHSARVALARLEKDVAKVPGASNSEDVQARLAKVRAQIEESASVRAGDLQALFDSVGDARKTYSAKVEAETRQLQFNTAIKGAASKLNARNAQFFIGTLQSKQVDPPFAKETVDDFLSFIKDTEALDLDLVGTSPIAYQKAQKAIAFAQNWTAALPKHALGSPKDRHLIDHLVSLVMRGCDIDARPAAEQLLGKFTRVDATTLHATGGTAFVRDQEPLGKGAYASVYGARSDDEIVVIKELELGTDDAALAEIRAHAQAKTGDSDHIVGLLGAVVQPGIRPMLVLEHAPNGHAKLVQARLLSGPARGTPAALHAFMTMFADMSKAWRRPTSMMLCISM